MDFEILTGDSAHEAKDSKGNSGRIKEPGEVHGNDQSVIRGLDTDRIMDRREALLSIYVNHRRGVTIV